MNWRKDLVGNKYGALHVLEHVVKKYGHHFWKCLCACGKISIVNGTHLKSGHTVTCGCRIIQKSKAARIRIPEYWIWCFMRQRCKNNDPDYGGRGISVCELWSKDFNQFLKDMGARPTEKHTIERIDVNGNYEPKNCKWILKSEQSENTRRTHKVDVLGVKMSLARACRHYGLNYWTVVYHVNKAGRTPEEALSRCIAKKNSGLYVNS